MKQENYKRSDIANAIEIKKLIQHHLGKIEMHLWTDDVDTAIKRTVDMHLEFVNLARLQSSKRLEDAFRKAGMNGMRVNVVNFGQKKAD